MRYIVILSCWILFSLTKLFAQNPKPCIDSNAIVNWPSLGYQLSITSDGNYCLYNIKNQPAGHNTFIVRSTFGDWKQSLEDVANVYFSSDNKRFFYQIKDTLVFQELGSSKEDKIANITSYNQPRSSIGKWLIYQIKNHNKEIVLFNCLNENKQIFSDITKYWFDDNGKILVIKKETKLDSFTKQSLDIINLESSTDQTIWSWNSTPNKKCDANGIVFDQGGHQLALLINMSNAETRENNSEVWCYKFETASAVLKINNQSPGIIESNMVINGDPLNSSLRFSKDGKWIFFNLIGKEEPRKLIQQFSKVNIWGYNDSILQPEQIRRLSDRSTIPKTTIAVNPDNGHISVIALKDEGISTPFAKGDFRIVSKQTSGSSDPGVKSSLGQAYYLVSLKDGSRKLLGKNNITGDFSFSPNGKYLVYYTYESKRGDYYSLNLQTGRKQNLTQNINVDFETNTYTGHVLNQGPVDKIGGWLDNYGVLVYDNNDIWLLNLNNERKARNITNGFGLKHNLKFRIIFKAEEYIDSYPMFSLKDTLLLTAFSLGNKYNGFYRKTIEQNANPILLTTGPYTYYRMESQKPHYYAFDDGMFPLKAKAANVWIIKRQSSTESPNYFLTQDFKKFKPITDLYPQKSYNWLTAELISWKMLNGEMSQGILYKPENFDSTKKYPLIFNYYEQLSHRLYEYPEPDFTKDNINIPWFVSRGYLVFTPDILYKYANISNKAYGWWAYNSVVSAAMYLSKLPFVNAKSMAIQGHSFGGGETNYIVTHSKMFAAAAEFAGDSDPISAYLTLTPAFSSIEHYSKQSIFEDGDIGYGATLWKRPDLYLKESAVLHANDITTPLLITHNEKDNSIQWRQGIEMYMALRRLGKKCWMLQYDDGHHGVSGIDAVDYTFRLTQFFDHYLKGDTAPIWMTRGVPAKLKQIETGYELDPNGKCGDDCPICNKNLKDKK